jgi:hypothetical protein
MVDINDANGKPKLKASPKSKLLPSDASSPYVGISPPSQRKEAGCHRLNEDEGDAPKAKHHKGSMFAKPNISEGKRAYADHVNNLEKAASDASDRAETYLQAVNRANKSPSWELPEATELFKFMHNKYAQLLKNFRLGIVRRGIKIICGIGMTNLGSTVMTVMMTTVTVAYLQAKPPEMHLKERKNISVV